jgi:hypothetical protein
MSLVNEIKQDLFTFKGVAVTIITDMIVLGVLGSWMFFNVHVMGNDVTLSVPSSKDVQELSRRR